MVSHFRIMSTSQGFIATFPGPCRSTESMAVHPRIDTSRYQQALRVAASIAAPLM